MIHSDFILIFNNSDKADQIRSEIYNEDVDIHVALANLMDQAYANEPINKPGVQDLRLLPAPGSVGVRGSSPLSSTV